MPKYTRNRIDKEQDQLLEDNVRRIARELWPAAEYGGSAITGGRERDGLFETEECVHFVEATTSRRMEKAQHDVDKLEQAIREHHRKGTGKPARGWFVTKEEPTADQRSTLGKRRQFIKALSFHQFQGQLVNAIAYISARDHYAFGSIADPVTGSKDPNVNYVPLDLVQRGTSDLWKTKDLCDALVSGRSFAVLGDYGAGKSMTLREVYRHLRVAYFKGKSTIFPIYVNLRDHSGQGNPAEVLERHARNIGFDKPAHLVRAWRAGYAVLLLDGFDEIATLGIQGSWEDLRPNRKRAVRAVRQFFREGPREVGICLAGRAHFFDNDDERRSALGLDARVVELDLNEFTDEQLAAYLKKSGALAFVPTWMPSRPLLVGYIMSKGLLTASDADPLAQLDPADGWIELIDRICARESLIDAGIDGPTVRRILERLATKARRTEPGMGPLSSAQVVAAFSEICGHPPEEQELVLLQRLPGLGVASTSDRSRTFMDEDFADVCRAGDVVAFVRDPYDIGTSLFSGTGKTLGQLGIGVASRRLDSERSARLTTALQVSGGRNSVDTLIADLVRICKDRAESIASKVYVRNVLVDEMELAGTDADLSNVEFQTCYFRTVKLDLTSISVARLPRFRDCFINEIQGPTGENQIPSNFETDCYIESFSDQPETINAILNLDLPLGTRVLMTILRKLYMQSGRGRRHGALARGLDQRGKQMVPRILAALQQEGFAVVIKRGDREIWLPNRSTRVRASRIIAEPSTCGDPLIAKVVRL